MGNFPQVPHLGTAAGFVVYTAISYSWGRNKLSVHFPFMEHGEECLARGQSRGAALTPVHNFTAPFY